MKRVIVDYKKLTSDILNLLAEEYPSGINEEDVITFKNSKNETVEAVEIRTEEAIYLVKVGVKLEQALQNFIDDDEDGTDYTMDSEASGISFDDD